MNQILPTISLHVLPKNEGTYINAIVFNHAGNNYHLEGRTTDTIHVFTEALGIYVLTINQVHGHVGLTCFMVPESDPINMVHLHNLMEIMEILGKGWQSLKPIVLVQKLIAYMS